MPLNLDTNEARKADNFSSVISESGKYTGIITRAEKILSRNGTEGFGFSFKSDDGATANYLDLWTIKSDGKRLMGHGMVNAILACTRLKSVVEGKITFPWWDRDAGGMIQKTSEGYPELMGKPIGVVLQMELQEDLEGRDKERLVVVAVFEKSTGFMASEILDKKTKPEKLDKIVATVTAKPLKDRRSSRSAPAASTRNGSSAPAREDGDPGWDDSIPF